MAGVGGAGRPWPSIAGGHGGPPQRAIFIKHSLVQMVRQRVYQIAAGYEDCHDADYLRIDPALRLATGKDHHTGQPVQALPVGERYPGHQERNSSDAILSVGQRGIA